METDDLWMLMIQRSDSPRDPWSGQMAFPGGRADPQDRTLFHTVAREVTEEVGIDVRIQEFIGCLHNVQPKNAPMIVSPFVFAIEHEVHPRPSSEAKEIVWVPLSFLLDSENISEIEIPIGSEQISMPCYVYLNHTIWGMSFRIMREIISKTGRGREGLANH
jgi:8-oxo-dGTP pyrophosphatase MutT (NUDIX family)